MSKSDFKKKNTNLNDFIPAQIRTEIIENINENVFNKFFTKPETDHIVGIIGDVNPADTSQFRVPESSTFKTSNQLQPIAHVKIGSVDHYMSFQDMMNRLKLLGADVDNFDTWGDVLQFNWVPPIDLDKFINYRDYFWDTAQVNDPPQYITIKNQLNWALARLYQAKRSVTAFTQTHSVKFTRAVDNLVAIAGSVATSYPVGELVLLSLSGRIETATVVSAVYNTSSLNTEIVFDFIPDVDFETINKTNLTVKLTNMTEKQFVVSGDVSSLMREGYVFSAFGGLTVERYLSVASVEYNANTNNSTITVNEAVPSVAFTNISLYPYISLIQGEINHLTGSFRNYLGEALDQNSIGNVVWVRDYQVLQAVATGTTTTGDNALVDIGVNFNTAGIAVGDTLWIKDGPNVGKYVILATNGNRLEVPYETRFFSDSTTLYEVIRNFSFTAIRTQPPTPVHDQLWFDTLTDTLRQYDSGTTSWVIKRYNVSVLLDTLNFRHLNPVVQSDDWSAQNKWIHKNQIASYQDKTRAVMPIIEFLPFLELSSTSYAEKLWSYSKSRQTADFVSTDVKPSMFEIHDIRLWDGDEFEFPAQSTIRLHSKFGNLVPDIEVGSQLRIEDCGVNSGIYTIVSVTFKQDGIANFYFTEIIVEELFVDLNERPLDAYVGPRYTKIGDVFLGFGDDTRLSHWRLDGIKDVAASSVSPLINPHTDTYYNTDTTNPAYETIVGLNWQEFKINGSDLLGPQFTFDDILSTTVLYEDYQEGDLRVYINGIRQFGTYGDTRTSFNEEYVGGIKINNNINITTRDVVRVEVGEYALNDIGKHAVLVDTLSGVELVNLVDYRKVDQIKSERNQYPIFCNYDINGNALNTASEIFKYAESEDADVNANLLIRTKKDANGDFEFVQTLLGENGELLAYNDRANIFEPIQTIWKRGFKSEIYQPTMVDGEWEIPNPFAYNLHHENRASVNFSQVYRHFRSIIAAQKTPGMFTTDSKTFHLDDNVNYGVGGTIKEHNGGFDKLVSAMFQDEVSVLDVIQFAHNQYVNQRHWLKEAFVATVADSILDGTLSDLNTDILAKFNTNNKFDEWFGDSNTFVNGLGIKNWVATLPFLGLAERVLPFVATDSKLGISSIVHHDGHRSSFGLDNAEVDQILRKLLKNTHIVGSQTVAESYSVFPTEILGRSVAVGDVIIRKETTTALTKVYILTTGSVWEEVKLLARLGDLLLTVETLLYEAAPVGFEPKYDSTLVTSNTKYDAYTEERFNDYLILNNISTPMVNGKGFSSSNPFTWNYAHTNLLTHPRLGSISSDLVNTNGCWQALYEIVYGTPYPHKEPWTIQGYGEKPAWWDAAYLNQDTSNTRYWNQFMWENVMSGTVPLTGLTPAGLPGTGLTGQCPILFTYIPVNITENITLDGYRPDELLPPYWNSANVTDSRVRPLFDANAQVDIVSPELVYEFGQTGTHEWIWSVSAQRLYDELAIAFLIQPLRVLNATLDRVTTPIGCLDVDTRSQKVYSHKDIIFHGDFIGTTNEIYTSTGMNQWYVNMARYSGFDGGGSEFRPKWTNWEAPLGYSFGAFVDNSSLQVSNSLFDVTSKDYEVKLKKTKNMDSRKITALEATALSVPSKYSKLRDAGIGWTVALNRKTPVKGDIKFYEVENFNFRSVSGSGVFEIYAYDLAGVDIDYPRGKRTVKYNQRLTLSGTTYLSPSGFYTATVTVDTLNIINLSISGAFAGTIATLINEINVQLGALAFAEIENGNLVIKSSTVGTLSRVEIADITLFNSTLPLYYSGISDEQTESYRFNKVFKLNGNQTSVFNAGSEMTVSDSTNYNGTYSILKVSFDVQNSQTLITVSDAVSIISGTVDGVIRPVDGKTLPVSWTAGTEVFLNSLGVLPTPLDEFAPYYLIPLTETTFSLSTVMGGLPIITGSAGSSISYVGKLERTFKALNGKTSKYIWRKHAIDKRYAVTMPVDLNISGIQQITDFIFGYGEYLEDNGFEFKSNSGNNRDTETSRVNGWQLEIEKLITWLYNIRSLRQEDEQFSFITFNSSTNSFTPSQNCTLATGTPVVFGANEGGRLPIRFKGVINSIVPYYLIRGVGGESYQLASSKLDATRGISIEFTDNGFGTLYFKPYKVLDTLPKFELNPFRNNVWIKHDTGILSDIFAYNRNGGNYQAIYDNSSNLLNVANLLVMRNDTESRISLTTALEEENTTSFSYNRTDGVKRVPSKTAKKQKYMTGMMLYIDGYEHIITFSDYSSNGILIYDSFLGLRTPRFALEFDRQQGQTFRPTVGGFVLRDGNLVPNFEHGVDSLRHAYDVDRPIHSDSMGEFARRGIGYDGSVDYMDDINLSKKTQFDLWRGMIQTKGTNFAMNAFANQKVFNNALIDEFWAYKVAEFGDVAERVYPEVKLYVSDTTKKELRLEFTSPDGGVLDSSFAEVNLTDVSRWWNQPDQIQSLSLKQAFYFDVNVIKIISDVLGQIEVINGKSLLVTDVISDGAIVTYFDVVSNRTKVLVEAVDFTFINSQIIHFPAETLQTLEDIGATDLTVSLVGVNADAHSPCRIIDKKTSTVVAEIPMWHPAVGIHSAVGYYPVTMEATTDPATYSNLPVGTEVSELTWGKNKIGTIWFDSSKTAYTPYYDKKIFPSIDYRMFNWGKLADYGDVKLYQWTESTVPPSGWAVAVTADNLSINAELKESKRTGTIITQLYVDVNAGLVGPVSWVEVNDIHFDIFAALVTTGTTLPMTGEFELYINGTFKTNVTLTGSFYDYVNNSVNGIGQSDYLHLIKRAYIPTQAELDKGIYKYDTPYTKVMKFDVIKGEEYPLYYFWVNQKTDRILINGKKYTTASEAEKQLKNINTPYMVLQGLRPGDSGYGVVFGVVYDENPYTLPYRYTQLVVKGLESTVKDEGRYALQVARDFALRDELTNTSIDRKNIHEEWKLFREKQLHPVDLVLWENVIKSMIGYRVTEQTVSEIAVPSLNRIVYDNIYASDTRFGIGNEQVMVPVKLAKETVLALLNDSSITYTRVDIRDFIARTDFNTQAGIVAAMYEIYDTFASDEVNRIFFAVLLDSLAYKKNYKDIFKTSWVALQIQQNVGTPVEYALPDLRLVEGPACVTYTESDYTPPEAPPIPTQSPTPSPTASPTPTPTPSPTPSAQSALILGGSNNVIFTNNSNPFNPAGWTPATVVDTTANAYQPACFVGDNGEYLAVNRWSTGKIYYTSSDRLTWTAYAVVSPGGFSFYSAAVNSGHTRWVMGTDAGGIFTSPNRTVWTKNVDVSAGSFYSGHYGNGLFVFPDTFGDIWTSPDGLSPWTRYGTIAPNNAGFTASVFAAGLHVAATDKGTCATSPDGITWTVHSTGLTAIGSPDALGCAWGNGLYMILGCNGEISTSTDGSTWTASTIPGLTNGNYGTLTFGNGVFIAAAGPFSSSSVFYGIYSSGILTWASTTTGGEGETLTGSGYLSVPP